MSSSTAPSREAQAADTPTDVAPPLVEAKLAPPRVRRGVVVRSRLLQALDAGGGTVLTLVGAPAGYGKTTAVRMWCATQDAALAWVTLDAGDNDPSQIWTYVATAVDRIRAGLGQPALRRLGVAGSQTEAAVDELMNALGRYGEPVILVLDDLHAVTDLDCLATIDHALHHAPENVRVIVNTRMDPALGLARLRAAQELTELRAADLAFTSPEAHALLVDRVGLELSDEQVDALVERTEGWPAALVLAGLWLRSVDDPSSAVAEFGGDQHFVADYLSTEVLAALDDDRRAFLQGLSVLGQFTPELCDAVLDRERLRRASSSSSSTPTSSCHDSSGTGGSASMHSSRSTRRRSSRRPIRVLLRASTCGRRRGSESVAARSRRWPTRRLPASTRWSPSCLPSSRWRSSAAGPAGRCCAGCARCRTTP